MGDSQPPSLPDTIRHEIPPQDVAPSGAEDSQKLRVGGFPEEMFENLCDNEKESLFCNICLNLVNQCQKCSNSHLFCRSCIFMWTNVTSSNASKCPVCRAPQVEYSSVPEIDQQLMVKDVTCPVDKCSFKSNLKLFLHHAHGKSMYCNEQKDYDKFKAERRRSNEEHLADENERLVELINFIERFNILQSLMSFEALLGNNRSFTLLNLLHSIADISNRTNAMGMGSLWDFSVPVGLTDSINAFGPLFTASNNQQTRARLMEGDPPNASSVSNTLQERNHERPRSRILNLPPNIQNNAVNRAMLDDFPGSGRTSNASSVSTSSSNGTSVDSSPRFMAGMTQRLDNFYDSDEEDYLDLALDRPGRISNGRMNDESFNFPEDFLISSASTDTLVGNNPMTSDGLTGREASDFRVLMSSFEDEVSFSPEISDILNHSMLGSSLLSSSDEPLEDNSFSFKDSSDSLAQQDLESETLAALPANRSTLHSVLPSRISGLPLMTTRKASTSANNRDVSSPSPFHSTSKAGKFTSHLESNNRKFPESMKPSSSSSKISLLPERSQHSRFLGLKSDKPKFNAVSTLGLNARKEMESLTLSRPRQSKPVAFKPSKEPSKHEVRISRQLSNHKLGEASKKSIPVASASRTDAFKLPSIYTPTSSRSSLKTNSSSRLPKVAMDQSDPARDRKVFPKASLSGIGKNKY